MKVASLIAGGATAEEVRQHLIELDPGPVHEECLALSPAELRTLWQRASADEVRPQARLVTGASAVYVGRNSLRLFSSFEKWFARLGDHVVGCNRHPLSSFIGPGYFSVVERGTDLEFDYSVVPSEAPTGWPRPAANTRLMARPVYGGLLDRVVWLTASTLIGAAFRDTRPLDSYFILVRSAELPYA